jgi:hypothetical protein
LQVKKKKREEIFATLYATGTFILDSQYLEAVHFVHNMEELARHVAGFVTDIFLEHP